MIEAGSHHGIAIGAHSWSHPNLARVTQEELESELRKPLDWLGSAGVNGVSVLAYPYGLYSREVMLAVEKAGYGSALKVSGGWLPRTGCSPWALPRYNVPAGISEEGFQLRLAGLFAR